MTHEDMEPIPMGRMKRCNARYGSIPEPTDRSSSSWAVEGPKVTCELPPESNPVGKMLHDLFNGHIGTSFSYHYLCRWGRGPYGE